MAGNGESTIKDESKEIESTNVDIDEAKRQKTKAKSLFTRTKHHLLNLLEQDLPSRRELCSVREKLIGLQQPLIDILLTLGGIQKTK